MASAFEWLASSLPRLHTEAAADGREALPSVGVAAFSDDIEPTPGDRVAVRVCLRDRPGGGLVVDLRDSSARTRTSAPFELDREDVSVAVVLALSSALQGTPRADARLLASLELLYAPESWIGVGRSSAHQAARAMAMARVFDAVSGALAQAWPMRVGAGACTLGAVIELGVPGELVREVLPGGEGAQPDRPGRHAWSGPILGTRVTASMPAWLRLEQRPRTGSGGGGARAGGDGIVRSYAVERSVTARVALDRRANPPHGLDRAGPPLGARLGIVTPDGHVREAAPWTDLVLPAGHRLVVETSGGAGHGFPGYGDLEVDDLFAALADPPQ